MISAMAVSEQSNSAKGSFRARCQSSQTANQGGVFFFLPGRETTVLMKTVIKAFSSFMTNSCASFKCAKQKSDQLSHSPQLFVIKYRPPWPIDEAHLEATEDASPLMAARDQLQENCREIKHLVFLEVNFLHKLIWLGVSWILEAI